MYSYKSEERNGEAKIVNQVLSMFREGEPISVRRILCRSIGPWLVSVDTRRGDIRGEMEMGDAAAAAAAVKWAPKRVTQLLRLHQKFMQNPGLTVPANQLCNGANVLPTRERENERARVGH